MADDTYKILSLDGGGAKGFYTLGVLREIEAMTKKPLHETFQLAFGTSTGAIIAALIGLGKSVKEINDLYTQHVPVVMKRKSVSGKTDALEHLTKDVFGDKKFTDVKTGVGIVATRWLNERPMIFKGSIDQAHGRKSSFVPGFGVPIADAVRASAPPILLSTRRSSRRPPATRWNWWTAASAPTIRPCTP